MREKPRPASSRLRGRRRAILEEQGLLYAPREIQRAFWSGYNSRRRSLPRVGDLVGGLFADQAARQHDLLARLTSAWVSILPEGYATRAQVESISGGCLRVVVDSSATRYVLSRQIGDRILSALNEACAGAAVTRLEYRVGRLRGRQSSRETEREGE